MSKKLARASALMVVFAIIFALVHPNLSLGCDESAESTPIEERVHETCCDAEDVVTSADEIHFSLNVKPGVRTEIPLYTFLFVASLERPPRPVVA